MKWQSCLSYISWRNILSRHLGVTIILLKSKLNDFKAMDSDDVKQIEGSTSSTMKVIYTDIIPGNYCSFLILISITLTLKNISTFRALHS